MTPPVRNSRPAPQPRDPSQPRRRRKAWGGAAARGALTAVLLAALGTGVVTIALLGCSRAKPQSAAPAGAAAKKSADTGAAAKGSADAGATAKGSADSSPAPKGSAETGVAAKGSADAVAAVKPNAETGAAVKPSAETGAAAKRSADSGAAAGAGEAQSREGGDKLTWGAEFAQWTRVTGYLFSRSHGQRLASIRATPPASAEVLMANAERLRQLKDAHLEKYPVGTMLVMQTWELEADLSRGASGPLFFMRKEAPGYDPEGGDWRYGMTRPDLSVLADGKDGRATACRTCHLTLKDRDFVPALDR
jgi:hypothetical protein